MDLHVDDSLIPELKELLLEHTTNPAVHSLLCSIRDAEDEHDDSEEDQEDTRDYFRCNC